MIKHHPNPSLLLAFSQGQLAASLSIAISTHIDHCQHCRHQVMALQETSAQYLDDNEPDLGEWDDDEMIAAITADDFEVHPKHSSPIQLNIKGTDYTLPRALQSVALSSWLKLGKLARARIDLNEGEVHTNLLHIEKGGTIPIHTHKGFELTVLLAGSFKDEHGEYVPGDFIWLNDTNTHSPATDTGCLCLTVANDSMHFVQGFSKALNPIGKLIY
ncbi:ChrR family anti-sigma-E factor [Paraglaciecola aquimarina]|uniref:ChrR family anti-sigma-E factor n=1 Tax=Paraglaciecola aquimarina TaxID=1235557 RepID=A0ABU3SXI0_9ALTE|nr:ChrR family anti-sigma-E factor [Paraglaciecola aquimarina]MDU0354712.1 ChrR family anti-sigma-E factor [Paraglaciecola aquimarina]